MKLNFFNLFLYYNGNNILIDTIDPYDILVYETNIKLGKCNFDIKSYDFIGMICKDNNIYLIYIQNIESLDLFIKKKNDNDMVIININNINVTNSSIILYRVISYIHHSDNNLQSLIIKNTDRYFVDKLDFFNYDKNEPYNYHINNHGKGIRNLFIDKITYIFCLDKEIIFNLKHLISSAHNASLLIDDIQDYGKLRRGMPCSYLVNGIPLTSNSAYMTIFAELNKIDKYINKNIAETKNNIIKSLYLLHIGQGMDIFWREYNICPTEKEYISMIELKTSEPFILCIKLIILQCKNYLILYNFLIYISNVLIYIYNLFEYFLSLFLNRNKKKDYYMNVQYRCYELARLMGIYFQINDDLINITNKEYITKKGVYDDIYEKKYSFLVTYIINNKIDGYETLIKYYHSSYSLSPNDVMTCVEIIKNKKTIDYTKEYLLKLKNQIIDLSIINLDWFFEKM